MLFIKMPLSRAHDLNENPFESQSLSGSASPNESEGIRYYASMSNEEKFHVHRHADHEVRERLNIELPCTA